MAKDENNERKKETIYRVYDTQILSRSPYYRSSFGTHELHSLKVVVLLTFPVDIVLKWSKLFRDKKDSAIAGMLRKWSHYLLGNHPTPTNDQRSVVFMCDRTQDGELQNLEADAPCRFEAKNKATDTLSQESWTVMSQRLKTHT